MGWFKIFIALHERIQASAKLHPTTPPQAFEQVRIKHKRTSKKQLTCH
uniref:Uncharacterized protein n=1 Tax=Arundo donax TaxID=35708 RepID=A0A0A9JFZ5_ARUDO